MKKKDLKVVFFQLNLAWENREQNLTHFDRQFSALKEEADLILLPEMFNTGFSINPEQCAEEMDGISIRYLKEKADTFQSVIMASLLVKIAGGYVNRLVAAHPGGKVEYYDKRHLFRLSEEFRIINSGKKKLIVNIQGWKILPLICYDLRFPVWSKNTYSGGKYEYDLIVYIANWPANRSLVWKTLLSARAMENQAYVIGVNRVGEDGHGTYHTGDSLAVDAKGNILAAAPANMETAGAVTLSFDDLDLYRESFTLGLDWDHFKIEKT